MTTTPDKDILNLFHANAKGHIGRAQEAKEWFELYRDGKELPEKGQAFLQDCVRELNGIPHEADNHTNGGAAVPSGEAGWRDDVPDETQADGEETMVEQEAHDHGGMVVEGDVWQFDDYDEILVLTVDCSGDNIVSFDETDRVFKTSRMLNSESWTLIKPSPLREQDKQDVTPVCDVEPESETVEVDNPESTQEPEGVVCGSGQSTGTETCGEQVTNSSEGISLEDEQAASGDTDSALSVDSDNGNNVLSRTSDRNAEVGSRAAQTENHPLASWIMEQEWAQDDHPEYTIPNLRIVCDYVHYSYHDNVNPEETIERFLSRHTPKGWERFDPPYPETSGEYEIVLVSGEQAVEEDAFVNSTTEILFIREHQPESKEDGQETNPANGTIPSATYTATVVGFAGDVCSDSSANSEWADVGRDQEPSGANGESIPAEYDDEITKEQHEKIVADTEQYQDQSQYQIVSGEPWNEQDTELEAGEGAPTAPLVAQADQRHVDESRVLGGEVGAGGERELTEPDGSTVGMDTGLPQTEHNTDVTEDPKGSTPDVGATSDTVLSNDSNSVEQPSLEDNGLEYLIKEQATELTEAEQKAVDLIEGRVGDELDKLEGVE